jgi:hypothetical protein
LGEDAEVVGAPVAAAYHPHAKGRRTHG